MVEKAGLEVEMGTLKKEVSTSEKTLAAKESKVCIEFNV